MASVHRLWLVKILFLKVITGSAKFLFISSTFTNLDRLNDLLVLFPQNVFN
jgi:hypothetical protein